MRVSVKILIDLSNLTIIFLRSKARPACFAVHVIKKKRKKKKKKKERKKERKRLV